MIRKFTKLLFILIFVIPLVFFTWWKIASAPAMPKSKETQVFVVRQGWGSTDIVRELKSSDLIKSGLAFHLMIIKEGFSNKLQAGDFRLSSSMNLFEISQALTHGILDVWVTIPEGLRREEVIKRISDAFKEQGVEVDIDDFLKQTASLEGYLFPDTYLIPKEVSSISIIRILQGTFEQLCH